MCFPRISPLYTPRTVRRKRTGKRQRKRRERRGEGCALQRPGGGRWRGDGECKDTLNTSKEDRVKVETAAMCPNSTEGEEWDDSD